MFRGYKTEFSRAQQCRSVLRQLVRDGHLKRFRLDSREQYIYHMGKRDSKWQHYLLYNRFHFNLIIQARSWQKIIAYQPEKWLNKDVRCDGYYIVQYTFNKGRKFVVEADRGTYEFNLVEKYEKLRQTNWQSTDWGKDEVFPIVVVVTERKEIPEVPEYFRVTNLEEVMSDVWNVLR
ncbi:MAG: hypothetical protein H0Z35_09320 [Thermoanaerobacteraceae bacterium]|nr:hypothetical protein [Thermoanaerobacteraceae bacterium]